MHVEPARPSDLPAVQAAYADGAQTQHAQQADVWPPFSDTFVRGEIAAGRLFKVVDGQALVGVFTVAYEDPVIWGARERGRHLYLHRIARAAAHPGRGLMDPILTWARSHAEALGRDGLRLDTWATNPALTAYYERVGFAVVGRQRIPEDTPLPPHYSGITVVLMEMPLGNG